MTNYLKLFEDETAYSAFTGSSEYITPNVSVCSGGGVAFSITQKRNTTTRRTISPL